MIATAVGFIVGLLVFLSGTYIPEVSREVSFPQSLFQGVFGLSVFLSLSPWVWVFLGCRKGKLCPVTQASASSCFQDQRLAVFSGSIFFLALLGILLCSQSILSLPLTLAVSFLSVGIIIDLLKNSFFRMQERCTPSGIADWLLNKFKAAARKGDEKGVLESFELIFSLLVRYGKEGDVTSLSLFSMRVVGLVEELLRTLSTLPLFKLSKEDTLLDRYGVAEAMTAKRLAWVMKVTGENGSPTALEETMRSYAKLFMVFHNYHESLGYLLFVSLSQNLLKIEKPTDVEKDAEFMMVCSELVKSLIDRSVDRRISEKNAILRIFKILETHERECFRRDKSISPAFLMQPFAEIGQLLGSERYNALQDREDILSELRRILAQFSALEMVSTRMEVAEPGTDTAATYREDLPFHREEEL
jgi:hypothetical protein